MQREGKKGGCGDRGRASKLWGSAVSGGDLSAFEDKSNGKNPKSHFPKSHTSAINQEKVGNPTEIPVNLTHCPISACGVVFRAVTCVLI